MMPEGKKFESGKKHWNWKGGKPKCAVCGKPIKGYKAKKCRLCWSKDPILKTIIIKYPNTGRTWFKKGQTPWNKDKKMIPTKANLAYFERQRGKSKNMPKDHSERCRKGKPPRGMKILRNNSYCRIDGDGYIQVFKPEHPSSKKGSPNYGYLMEHRYIMERKLGRLLTAREVIHHLDGIKHNNNIKNLLLCENNREHGLIHKKMECLMGELIEQGKVYYDTTEKKFKFRENN